MNESEVQALFLRFAQPMAPLRDAGANQQTLNSLARSLWAAMIGGDAAEQSLWNALREDAAVDEAVIGVVQLCYQQEMKPAVSEQELTALRARYGIAGEQPPEAQ